MNGQRWQIFSLVGLTMTCLHMEETLACTTIRENTKLMPGKIEYINSPNYPMAYPNTIEVFVYRTKAPMGHKVVMFCDHFDVEFSKNCSQAWFAWSRTGDGNLNDARYFCGQKVNLTLQTDGIFFAAKFVNNGLNLKKKMGFHCLVKAVPIVSITTVSPTTIASKRPTTKPTTTSATTPITTRTTTATLTSPRPPPPSSPSPEAVCTCGVKGDKPPPGPKGSSNKIVGGTKASINEYPWIIAMTTASGFHFCGGSLIENQWVLTASHCVDGKSPSSIRVVLGEHDFLTDDESPSFVAGVAAIIMHEHYNKQTIDNDIALLRLTSSVDYSPTVGPVCLPYQLLDAHLQGKMVTVAGWGTTSSGGYASKTLLEADIPLLMTSECRKFSSMASHLTTNMICTYEVGKDSCQGDSGGPLTYHINGTSYQVGIVSWGFGCAEQDMPGVYTKLNNYLDWIRDKIGKALCSL